MSIPPWLESLLSTTFFLGCSIHGASARSECNMYCLDCAGGAFCIYCREAMHRHHNVIQIRRSSYHDVVRMSEIQRFMDIGGVQTYVINSARVLFLNERAQPRGATTAGKTAGHACEMCGRTLLDSSRFCSLGCKVAAINNSKNLHLLHGAAEMAEEDKEKRSHVSIYGSTSPPPRATNSKGRRRKGIPQRSPLGT